MRDDRNYLRHILDAMGYIQAGTVEGRDAFLANRILQDAAMRNLEIIGEATKNLSEELRAQYPQVPWRKMARLRDKLIHQYFSVNLELVWDIIENDLPGFRPKIEKILRQLDQVAKGGNHAQGED
jgi:uncharacterized protein with HEPN domain